MIRLFAVLLILVVMFGCDPSRVLEDNQELPAYVWVKGQRVNFDFQIDDAYGSYNLYMNVRNSNLYPFQNLYCKYFLADSSGEILHDELVNLLLFEPKTGNPLGDGLGDLFDHQQLILSDYTFDHPGNYSIGFEQYMRVDSLPLILSVGARVERFSSPKD